MKHLFLSLIVTILLGCGGGGGSISPPAPTPLTPIDPARTFYYGYYGVRDTQIPETLAHTNLLFELGHAGEAAGLQHIAEARQPTVLGLQAQLWMWPSPTFSLPFLLNPLAEANIRARFNELRQANLLQYIIALYPIDEPEFTVRNPALVAEAVRIVRTVAAEFPELANVKLAVFYNYSSSPYSNIDLFDWVGIDHYKIGADILNEPLNSLHAQLRPDQRIMLIPGGYRGQDPNPFANYAISDPQVIALVPFIWYDNADPANGVVSGIRSNGMAQSYCLAGRHLTGKPDPC